MFDARLKLRVRSEVCNKVVISLSRKDKFMIMSTKFMILVSTHTIFNGLGFTSHLFQTKRSTN